MRLMSVMAATVLMITSVSAFAQSPGAIAGNAPDQVHSRTAVKQIKTMDDLLLDVAAQAPGFGGMFLKPDEKVLYVYTQTPDEFSLTIKAIEAVFGQKRIPQGGIKLVQARYNMRELATWYTALVHNVFQIDGVVATDLQEAQNMIWVGVERLEVQPVVLEIAASLGIPEQAIAIEPYTRPQEESHTTVTSTVRPLTGGYQLHNATTGDVCTIGFLTVRDNQPGIVTNHHCTKTKAAVDGDTFHQPVADTSKPSNTLIGNETIDPGWFTNSTVPSCPTGKQCRRSDSAFIAYTGSIGFTRGYIAQPEVLGSLTISHTNPTFSIVEEGVAAVGDIANKVGKTTGWTSGNVTRTCFNFTKASGEVLICQDEANYTSNGGDSGSPVFVWLTGNDVRLIGIHHSGPTGGGAGTRVFSPLGGVYGDLGANLSWWTCPAGLNC